MKPVVLFSTLVTILLQSAPGAVEGRSLTEPEIREKWSRVIYCDRIYRHPDNRSRVYEFDIAQCDTAADRMLEQALLHGEGRAKVLEDMAGQRATEIEYSTRDVTAVINACRDSCRKLAIEPDAEATVD